MRFYILLFVSFFFFQFSCLAQEHTSFHKTSNIKSHTYATNSVLKSGNWIKLSVTEDGIYKITYDDLVQYGFNPASIDPRNIKIFGNGGGMLPEYNLVQNYDDLIENPIYVAGESDGHFDLNDYILFYGQSPVKWQFDSLRKAFTHQINYYSDETCYFLTVDSSPGKRIQTQNSSTQTPTQIITSFDDYIYHEKDSINLIHSGREWYGEYIDNTNSFSTNYNILNINLSSRTVLRTSFVARNTVNSKLEVITNGNIDTITATAIPAGQPNADYAKAAEDTLNFTPSGSNINISINLSTPGSVGWLNFIELNFERYLTFSGQPLFFRNIQSKGAGNFSEFKISNINSACVVWDITNPFDIKQQQFSVNGNELGYIVPTDSLKQFVVFDESTFLSPKFEGKILNQNLHGLSSADFIIITHPDFITEANRLATIHLENDNLSSIIVTPQEIYNEFSSGTQDIAAIRNFLRMFFDRADSSTNHPKYLLLFGDASYDYKNRFATNTNYVPSYESDNSLIFTSSYVTDDFFGLMDLYDGFYCNGNLDIGIGRFPVQTLDEAKALVDKVETYLTKKSTYSEMNGCTPFTKEIAGDWRNTACFVADDEDNDTHITQADENASYTDTLDYNININKIYLDAYLQINALSGPSYPDVTKAINKQVQEGALVINYTGHGGETGWANEHVLQLSDILSWTNIYSMPVFVTATCEFSRFDNPAQTSAGEDVLLNANGGGIALFTTTRLAFSANNFSLNKSICKYMFNQPNGSHLRFGDILKLSKVENGSNINIRNFVLLGDPVLKLSMPENTVVTTQLNGHAANSTTDTLKALSKVTIAGIIQDSSGQKMTSFNGKIYPTVFDKKYITTTLSNDPTSPPFNFSQQNRILFKGESTVKNGDFTFSFILPKDMDKSIGLGKISYYAKDSIIDASGYYSGQDFTIGTLDSSAVIDNTGPSIKLYMNNTNFISGNTTDKNPILLAVLEDSSGINSTGNGLGHDIAAVLDGDTKNIIILNYYYSPNANTYKSGIVAYPFMNLTEGVHTLTLTAWDMYNNSSEASIDFIVTTPSSLLLKNIYNYPNPFSDKTGFYFEHNQPCCDLDVEINIYSINGSLVKTIITTVEPVGYDISPIEWDGSNNFGAKIESGIYIYKIKVKTSDGSYLESSNKLIIVK